MLLAGVFDPQGHPRIVIEMSAPLQGAPFYQITGMFDTGCTAVALIPINIAFIMRLTALGSAPTRMADGVVLSLPFSRVSCRIGTVAKPADIIVAPQGSDVLFGMNLLRLFELKALIDPGSGVVQLSS